MALEEVGDAVEAAAGDDPPAETLWVEQKKLARHFDKSSIHYAPCKRAVYCAHSWSSRRDYTSTASMICASLHFTSGKRHASEAPLLLFFPSDGATALSTFDDRLTATHMPTLRNKPRKGEQGRRKSRTNVPKC